MRNRDAPGRVRISGLVVEFAPIQIQIADAQRHGLRSPHRILKALRSAAAPAGRSAHAPDRALLARPAEFDRDDLQRDIEPGRRLRIAIGRLPAPAG